MQRKNSYYSEIHTKYALLINRTKVLADFVDKIKIFSIIFLLSDQTLFNEKNEATILVVKSPVILIPINPPFQIRSISMQLHTTGRVLT